MKAVFDKLYDNYHQDLFQYIFYMVKDRETTEDLVQEVYIKVLKSYQNFKGESTEKTWLFSIARHVTYDYFRSLKRKRNRIIDLFDWEEKGSNIADSNDLPEEVAIKNDQLKRIYTCLDKCTIDQKSVLILRYLQSFSIQETAEILHFSVSKVKTTQHRGLKALKKLLLEQEEKGGDVQ
ncbi:RNA polymerase sigma factor SigX [Oceanobacillus saliphilus]|uniref:RNA polymerase sigma factor SigX n=1 Tax=Oceanobacillus saliphilus TaxID=2925834 RepID=UPI00201DDB3A|nr:RNA polymerase sigma factor SigX [Oceanobacillus saliphilus]